MRRPVVTALFLCAVATLSGCPIYDHEDAGCYNDNDCGVGFLCDGRSGDCYQPSSSSPNNSCSRPQDCGVNQTCSQSGACVVGDCTFSGCVSGYECDASSGIWSCVLNGSVGAAGAAGAGPSTNDNAGQGGAL